jgi:hypothetical protein
MYRIAVPDESSGRPERMYCHRIDSLRVVANPYLSRCSGRDHVLPLGSHSLKSWTIS